MGRDRAQVPCTVGRLWAVAPEPSFGSFWEEGWQHWSCLQAAPSPGSVSGCSLSGRNLGAGGVSKPILSHPWCLDPLETLSQAQAGGGWPQKDHIPTSLSACQQDHDRCGEHSGACLWDSPVTHSLSGPLNFFRQDVPLEQAWREIQVP